MTNQRKQRLTPLQLRILGALPGTMPPWALTGGAALAGFHLQHRTTRDLDVFWHGCQQLGEERDACIRGLRADGLVVQSLQREPAFERLLVSDGSETVRVDFVAEPVQTVEPPMAVPFGAVSILMDTPHEILVNKLCALLGRAELRDLVDVGALIDRGEDLDRALRDAPDKDAGFSAVTLAWVLRGLPITVLADADDLDEPERARLENLRDHLVEKLLRETRPE